MPHRLAPSCAALSTGQSVGWDSGASARPTGFAGVARPAECLHAGSLSTGSQQWPRSGSHSSGVPATAWQQRRPCSDSHTGPQHACRQPARASLHAMHHQAYTCVSPAAAQQDGDSSGGSGGNTAAGRARRSSLVQASDSSVEERGHAGHVTAAAHIVSFAPAALASAEQAAQKAVSARLLPLLTALVVVSFIDRSNLAFASIQMSHQLGLSASQYGLGAGAFAVAYAAGQLPSAFALRRFGGPAWLGAIAAAWGCAAAACAATQGPVSFVALRLLLGLCESGALPGVWSYMAAFYPAGRTTVPYAVVEAGITASQVVAAPIAAGLLLLDGVAGLAGWQWLFILEALPALVLGCMLRALLPASIEAAPFLTAREKDALTIALAAAHDTAATLPKPPAGAAGTASSLPHAHAAAPLGAQQDCDSDPGMGATGAKPGAPEADRSDDAQLLSEDPAVHERQLLLDCQRPSAPPGASSGSSSSSSGGWRRDMATVLCDRCMLYAGAWRVLHDMPGTAVLYWTPVLVQALLLAAGGATAAASGSGSSGRTAAEPAAGAGVVLLSAVPYAAASLAHLANAAHSQATGERRLHIAITWLVGAAALAALPLAAGGLAAGGSAGASPSAPLPLWAAGVAFALLVLAHIGVNGANGLQTGLVAAAIAPGSDKALSLALYNTIGQAGSFLGPVLVGLMADATPGGLGLAVLLLAVCLASAAVMVLRFDPARLRQRRGVDTW